MGVSAKLFALMIGLGFMGACSEPKAEIPPYYVPSAALVQKCGRPAPNASLLLPASDGDIEIARAEKVLFGSYPLSEYSAYTLFTYDAQVISHSDGNVGYRYRWVVQQGVSAPQSP